jgi:serine/threonine protein kinase
MTDSVPEKLGKYKIIEEVGRGGFAAVYKAVDTTLDRTVALKVLAPHLLWDPTFVQRFQREAKVAANLDHANIVTIYEVGHIEGVYFIAMQFLEGRTLSQILEAEGPLPVSRVQGVIEQVASALDYAHARGFVHRDIKPSNVIVADDGRATLTDFGLVKAGEGTKLSTTGVVFGTPEYMSPEQAEGKVLDARSDVYSLGVVLYEMLAGRAPFVADTTPAVMYKHVHEPPPLEELSSDLPQSVVAVVEKALAKKREARYQSVGEMAAALQQAVSEAVVEEVKAPPELVLHPSLALQLSVKPQTVDMGGEAEWTVTLHNDGDDDLRQVTVRRGRTLLDEPFDLAAGKRRRFTFSTTYKTEGKKSEKMTATGIASTGESVSDEARATVEVAPIPPEAAAVAKEKLRLPAAPPAPKAVPKKALAVAGGLAVILIAAAVYYSASTATARARYTATAQARRNATATAEARAAVTATTQARYTATAQAWRNVTATAEARAAATTAAQTQRDATAMAEARAAGTATAQARRTATAQVLKKATATAEARAAATATARMRSTATARARRNATTTAEAQAAVTAEAQAAATAAVLACVHDTAIAPAHWPIILCDTFDTNVNDWLTGDYSSERVTGGNRDVTNGKYRWEANSSQGVVWRAIPDIASVSDFYLTMEARRVSGSERGRYGLVFRYADRDYYWVKIGDDQNFRLDLRYEDEWTTLIGWTETSAIRPGQVNRLTVIAEGTHFTFYVNDQYVGEADDSRLSIGRVGVAVEIYAGDAAVFEFDNFEVRAP